MMMMTAVVTGMAIRRFLSGCNAPAFVLMTGVFVLVMAVFWLLLVRTSLAVLLHGYRRMMSVLITATRTGVMAMRGRFWRVFHTRRDGASPPVLHPTHRADIRHGTAALIRDEKNATQALCSTARRSNLPKRARA